MICKTLFSKDSPPVSRSMFPPLLHLLFLKTPETLRSPTSMSIEGELSWSQVVLYIYLLYYPLRTPAFQALTWFISGSELFPALLYSEGNDSI